MSNVIPFSAACERNKDVILEAITPILAKSGSVLEIGTGTAQHAVYFSQAFPELLWQTSDQEEYLQGIRAQLRNASVDNVLMPVELNVNQPVWLPSAQKFQVIYTANTFHIMSWQDVQAFFKGLASVTSPSAYLIIYGPFKYAGKFTSESNREFDQTLRSRECGSAIRDFEAINELAGLANFNLYSDTAMPANNQCLVYQRGAIED